MIKNSCLSLNNYDKLRKISEISLLRLYIILSTFQLVLALTFMLILIFPSLIILGLLMYICCYLDLCYWFGEGIRLLAEYWIKGASLYISCSRADNLWLHLQFRHAKEKKSSRIKKQNDWNKAHKSKLDLRLHLHR